MPRALAILRLDDPAPPPTLLLLTCFLAMVSALRSEAAPPPPTLPSALLFFYVCVCVCLHACCTHRSVISHTHSPLVAGDWFNIPLGNLCKTNSLQEWKGLEEGRKREGGMEGGGGGGGGREEGICGEIIIPSVTVATFYEVDVNKRELHNPFQF